MSKKADDLSTIMELTEQLSDAYRENAELQRRLAALTQSDAERIQELEAECGRFENALFEARAALAQSDAEPVAWEYKTADEWQRISLENYKILKGCSFELRPVFDAEPPGHTDLMVRPETADAFMDANPLPTDAEPAGLFNEIIENYRMGIRPIGLIDEYFGFPSMTAPPHAADRSGK